RSKRDWSSDVCSSDLKISKYFNPEKEKEILQCSYFVPEIFDSRTPEEIALKKEVIRLIKRYVKTSLSVDNSILREVTEEKSLSRSEERRVGKECKLRS